jgi:ABC-type transporter Mla subunit MlaD
MNDSEMNEEEINLGEEERPPEIAKRLQESAAALEKMETIFSELIGHEEAQRKDADSIGKAADSLKEHNETTAAATKQLSTAMKSANKVFVEATIALAETTELLNQAIESLQEANTAAVKRTVRWLKVLCFALSTVVALTLYVVLTK